MRKRDEIANPVSCLNRAADDEMVFVLRGHDVAAPDTIRQWCSARIRYGKNNRDDLHISEAMNCAMIMERERDMADAAGVCLPPPAIARVSSPSPTDLVAEWDRATEALDDAQAEVRKAEKVLMNAVMSLGKSLVPGNAKDGEKFCIWHRGALMEVTYIRSGTFSVAVRDGMKREGQR